MEHNRPIVGRYYEDFAVGDAFESPGRTITESDVVQYAALSGDYNQIHTDEEYAKGCGGVAPHAIEIGCDRSYFESAGESLSASGFQ